MRDTQYPAGKTEYIIKYDLLDNGKMSYWVDGEPVTNDSTDVIYKLRHMTTWTTRLKAPRHQDVRDACVLAKQNEMAYRLKCSFGKWVILPLPQQRTGQPASATV